MMRRVLQRCLATACRGITLLVLLTGLFVGTPADTFAAPPEGGRMLRIVSLAPSVTEALFALGAGSQVVGVTRYCDYPPEARKLPKVGGYLDPNYEAIAVLRPDLVVTLWEHEDMRARLQQLGLRSIGLRNESVAQIFDSLAVLAKAVDREVEGRALVEGIRGTLTRIGQETSRLTPVPVLVVVAGHEGGGRLDRIHAASSGSILGEAIKIAGGRNAVPPSSARYPAFSIEGLIALDPEVIIDLVPEGTAEPREKLLGAWQALPVLRAVKQDRVYLFTEEHLVNPGPRFALTVEKFACAIHGAELSFCGAESGL